MQDIHPQNTLCQVVVHIPSVLAYMRATSHSYYMFKTCSKIKLEQLISRVARMVYMACQTQNMGIGRLSSTFAKFCACYPSMLSKTRKPYTQGFAKSLGRVQKVHLF